MNDCVNAEVRDALPDLLHGRLSGLDRATMKAHVDGCADCRAELALMERVRAYSPLSPSIDVSRIVSMLPLPVTSADHQTASIDSARQRSPMSTVWKLAAAVALIVAGTLTFLNAKERKLPSGAVATVAPAPSASGVVAVPAVAPMPAPTDVAMLPPVSSAQKERVRGAAMSGLSLTGGLQDLSDAQLEALLRDVNNVDGLPTSEPEAINVVVDGNEGLQ